MYGKQSYSFICVTNVIMYRSDSLVCVVDILPRRAHVGTTQRAHKECPQCHYVRGSYSALISMLVVRPLVMITPHVILTYRGLRGYYLLDDMFQMGVRIVSSMLVHVHWLVWQSKHQRKFQGTFSWSSRQCTLQL